MINIINKNIARVILFALLVSPAANAKDYIVEMIFFTDTKAGSANSIHISTEPVIPNLQGSLVLDDSAVNYGFVPYPNEALTLTNEAAALNKTGRYKVLKHAAWLQPGLAKEEAIPVRIHAGKDYRNEFRERSFVQTDFSDRKHPKNHPVNELDGTIKIVLGRYLHVYTDLAYRRPFSANTIGNDNALGRDRVLADFAIKTHRKMRSKQLHYLDHPILGILVEIRPADS